MDKIDNGGHFCLILVLVNGRPGEKFQPTRGFRQGDPLSPSLFIICAEGLSSLIQQAKRLGEIKGVTVERGGPQINHLSFANDRVISIEQRWRNGRNFSLFYCYMNKPLDSHLTGRKLLSFSVQTQRQE